MKTIATEVFEFDELPEAAKEKAMEWFRESSRNDDFWSEYPLEEAAQQGELLGIDFATRDVPLHGGGKRQEPKIYYSGFYHQGSGACFEGTWRARDVKADQVADGWGTSPATVELKRIAAVFDAIAKEYPEASFTVKHRGHYQHENCTEFDTDPGDYEEHCRALPDTEGSCEAWVNKFPEEELKENAKDFMRWIYASLQAAYESENSDEQVGENIRANGYTFTIKGKRFG